MSKKWPYALVALGGFALGGITCGPSGYALGYYYSEPQIVYLNHETHGIEGMCVYKNNKEMVCAADVNYDGAVDVAILDIETQKIKEILPGKDDCVNKYLRTLEEELQKQPKQQ